MDFKTVSVRYQCDVLIVLCQVLIEINKNYSDVIVFDSYFLVVEKIQFATRLE
jgi:hypothetical protein